MPQRIYEAAKLVWDYHQLHHVMVESDCILVLGSNDERVVDRAVELYQQKFARYIIFSGGVGELTKGLYNTSEAEHFANIAIELGVPKEAILIEPDSTNTGENIIFTQRLLQQQGVIPQRMILVQKPFMERRTLATFEQQWPDMSAVVTSPNIMLDDYPNDIISMADLINVMVGDLQRIRYYPAFGFSKEQQIPSKVWQAFEYLVKRGFDQHLSLEIMKKVSAFS